MIFNYYGPRQASTVPQLQLLPHTHTHTDIPHIVGQLVNLFNYDNQMRPSGQGAEGDGEEELDETST